jgi:hypothetical protein
VSKDIRKKLDEKTNFAGVKTVSKERIKELRSWAKNNIAGKEVFHKELKNNINFTVTGIKEYLNQPHEFYYEKNEMIKDVQGIVKDSKYMGYVNFKNRISHIFEIEIKRKNSWLIANEHQGRGITFYSISDSQKVLTGVKK